MAALSETSIDTWVSVDLIASYALTNLHRSSRNAIVSPLLRLPAELRTAIWALAYSDLTINIDGYDRPGVHEREMTSGKHHLAYLTCGAGTRWICPHIYMTSNFGHLYQWMHCNDGSRFSHPLVCKQFWAETTQVLLETSTWVFHNQHDLRLLVNSKQAWVRDIRRMVINATWNTNLVSFCHTWEQVLTWRLLRRFENLQGVRIIIGLGYDRSGMLMRTDLLKDRMWIKAKLPMIIRAFQQHNLKEDLTDVEVRLSHVNQWYPEYRSTNTSAWQSALRKLLLEYLPLGQGPTRSERKRMVEEAKRKKIRTQNSDPL